MDRIGKYEILDEIGAGGFGTVYRGRDTILKRMVAIKTCSSEDDLLRQRFRREAEIVAGLQHPNITTIHDLGEQDGVPYLVQEFLDGEDLSHVIGRRDDLSYEQRARLLFGVASGLAHAHANGIIHRDIKPSNVRVLSNGSVKVMDFGIAKVGDVQTELTRTGMMLGTGPYLAPEQLTDEQLDSRCDIFSFGVVAYELLAYQRPFEASTFSALLYKILNQPHTPIRDLCPELDEQLVELVERCLIKDRDRRIASFDEIRSQLAQILNISEERKLPPTSQVALDPTVSYDSGSAQRSVPPPNDENSATVLMSSAEASAATMREAAKHAPEGAATPPAGAEQSPNRTVPMIAAAVVVAGLAVASAVWLRGAGEPTDVQPSAPIEVTPTSPEASTETAAETSQLPAAGSETASTPAPSTAASAEPEPRRPESSTTPPPRQPEPRPATEATTRPRREAEPTSTAPAEGEPRSSAVDTPPPVAADPTVEESATRPEAQDPPSTAVTTSPSRQPPPGAEEPPTAASEPATTTRAAPTTPPVAPPPEPATPDPAVEEAKIRAALDRYRRAYEALDIQALVAAWPSLDSESRGRLERGFGSYQALSMTIDGCTYEVAATTALARCTVHQEVTPKGGRKLTSDRQVDFHLSKRQDTWFIEAL